MFKKESILYLSLLLYVATLQGCGFDEAYESRRSEVVVTEEFQQIHQHVTPLDKEPKKTSYEPILADRYYIKSLFEDIFGDKALTTDSARIFLNAFEFGSPCSVYESYRIYNSKNKLVLANSMENCSVNTLSRVNTTVNPKVTVTRQALLARACSDLTTNEKTFTTALQKLLKKGQKIPDRTRENILKAFRLFYRGKPEPKEGLVDALLVMLPRTNTTKEHWRAVFNSLCSSSFWQVL